MLFDCLGRVKRLIQSKRSSRKGRKEYKIMRRAQLAELVAKKTEQKKDAENATPWWMKLEVLFMAFLLIFFSVVVWVVR